MITKSFISMLCMHNILCRNMPKFKIWLLSNNWPNIIKSVKKNLDLFKAMKLCDGAMQKMKNEVIANIKLQKVMWLVDKNSAWAAKNTITFKQQLK